MNTEQQEREAFEAWAKFNLTIEGIAAKLAAKQAWKARAALEAQPQAAQEPVAWLISYPDEPELGHWFSEGEAVAPCKSIPLYPHPSPQEQEPVPGVVWEDGRAFLVMPGKEDTNIALKGGQRLYLHPAPQVQAVPDGLAERMRAAAFEVFSGPDCTQEVLDAIEYCYGFLLVAPSAPAQPDKDKS